MIAITGARAEPPHQKHGMREPTAGAGLIFESFAQIGFWGWQGQQTDHVTDSGTPLGLD